MLNVEDLATHVLQRLDSDRLEIGSAHEMGQSHYRGIPGRKIVTFRYSDIIPLDSLTEALHEALTHAGIEHE